MAYINCYFRCNLRNITFKVIQELPNRVYNRVNLFIYLENTIHRFPGSCRESIGILLKEKWIKCPERFCQMQPYILILDSHANLHWANTREHSYYFSIANVCILNHCLRAIELDGLLIDGIKLKRGMKLIGMLRIF